MKSVAVVLNETLPIGLRYRLESSEGRRVASRVEQHAVVWDRKRILLEDTILKKIGVAS